NGCSGLTSIVGEKGNTKYDSRNNCNAIIETASNTLIRGCETTVIPNSVTAIGSWAFNGCSGLTSIVVEKGNTTFDSRNNCNAIIETASNTLIQGCNTTVIPNNVESIGGNAFYGCSGLTSIEIPNSVTSIGDRTFAHCSGLTSLTIPNSVTSIGSNAFQDCSGLTSVTIPSSVTSIGNWAFSYCRNIKKITSYIQEPFVTGCWYYVDNSIPLYVPVGLKEKYQSTYGWKEFTHIIEFGATVIEPATEPKEVDMAVVPDQMDLSGMVVGYTYYALDAENGDGADSDNGCVVINTKTTDEAVNGIAGKDISDASVKAVFKGIIFMVPAGTGTVSINAETLGTSSLKVKIGSQAAQAFQLAERETVEIPYSVAEPTYVYIYAGTGTLAARSVGAARAAAAENSVKVYSYKWEPTDPTGINSIDNSQSATGNEAGDWYTIDGRKLSGKPAQKGIYIVNGRKVAVK
ncbi:MAG: leucine-rich repeat domain-containing protein, partial [Prevotella sp.]|nr:leucine-rich repeat domain-containing protein [Prevotella sp.]